LEVLEIEKNYYLVCRPYHWNEIARNFQIRIYRVNEAIKDLFLINISNQLFPVI
jgi:hypothetical protein